MNFFRHNFFRENRFIYYGFMESGADVLTSISKLIDVGTEFISFTANTVTSGLDFLKIGGGEVKEYVKGFFGGKIEELPEYSLMPTIAKDIYNKLLDAYLIKGFSPNFYDAAHYHVNMLYLQALNQYFKDTFDPIAIKVNGVYARLKEVEKNYPRNYKKSVSYRKHEASLIAKKDRRDVIAVTPGDDEEADAAVSQVRENAARYEAALSYPIQEYVTSEIEVPPGSNNKFSTIVFKGTGRPDKNVKDAVEEYEELSEVLVRPKEYMEKYLKQIALVADARNQIYAGLTNAEKTKFNTWMMQ